MKNKVSILIMKDSLTQYFGRRDRAQYALERAGMDGKIIQRLATAVIDSLYITHRKILREISTNAARREQAVDLDVLSALLGNSKTWEQVKADDGKEVVKSFLTHEGLTVSSDVLDLLHNFALHQAAFTYQRRLEDYREMEENRGSTDS